jgi:hypothetical protein
MSALSRWWPALVILGVAAPASAHVAPSADTNNRYLNVTPMGDRVRFAYTVLIGETPGIVARHALDKDGDQSVSEAEADAWGRDLGERIRTGLAVTIDGVAVPVTWSEVFVGMDDRSINGGAFSLDLIAWLCVPDAGSRRTVDIVDPFSLTPVGETEVRIADEPGVSVEVARVGQNDMAGRVARFDTVAAPLADGLHLVYTAEDASPRRDGLCPAPKVKRATPRWPVLLGAVLALALVIGLAVRRRARS